MMSQAERYEFVKEVNAVIAPLGAEALSWRVEDYCEIAIFRVSGSAPLYIQSREDWQARQADIVQSLQK